MCYNSLYYSTLYILRFSTSLHGGLFISSSMGERASGVVALVWWMSLRCTSSVSAVAWHLTEAIM